MRLYHNNTAFARDSVWNFRFFLCFALWKRAGVCAAFCLARDSVLDLDFGDIGFKKESLLVFVSFLGKRSLFGSLAKMKNGNFLGDCVSGSEVGFLKL